VLATRSANASSTDRPSFCLAVWGAASVFEATFEGFADGFVSTLSDAGLFGCTLSFDTI